MKKYNPPKENDKPTPSKSNSKQKLVRTFILEYRWRSEKDFNTYPKGFLNKEKYSEEWQKNTLHPNHTSIEGAKNYLKFCLRNSFMTRFLEGRDWRCRNILNNEVTIFENILEYYK